MAKKNNKPVEEIKVDAAEVVETEIKNWQSFTLKKDFPTSKKMYKAGETFKHYDERVINYLKSQNII